LPGRKPRGKQAKREPIWEHKALKEVIMPFYYREKGTGPQGGGALRSVVSKDTVGFKKGKEKGTGGRSPGKKGERGQIALD